MPTLITSFPYFALPMANTSQQLLFLWRQSTVPYPFSTWRIQLLYGKPTMSLFFLNQLKFRYHEAAGSKIVACFARTQNVRALFRFVKRSIVCQLFVGRNNTTKMKNRPKAAFPNTPNTLNAWRIACGGAPCANQLFYAQLHAHRG